MNFDKIKPGDFVIVNHDNGLSTRILIKKVSKNIIEGYFSLWAFSIPEKGNYYSSVKFFVHEFFSKARTKIIKTT